MPLFKRASSGEVAALIDIGSASVLVAYVFTDTDGSLPKIIWSHREHLPLRAKATAEQLAKNMLSALMNANIALETTGRKVLEAENLHYPNKVSVSVSAPWSYTVSKTISYVADEPFSVTDDLLNELSHTAETKITEELEGQETAHSLGLTVTCHSTTNILANSYPIKKASGQKASSLSLSRVSGIVQSFLVTALHDIRDKTFPKAELRIHPFMMGYFEVVRTTIPDNTEMSLIDVTYEATEIGIVRDGVLQYCTHTASGAYSLARELATEKGITPDEAFGILQHPNELTESQSSNLDEQYETVLSELFKETGDRLSIPKTAYLHCSGALEDYLQPRIANAGKSATGGEVFVVPFTRTKEVSSQVTSSPSHDKALLVSLLFFHISKTQTVHTWH